jgi:hypothetical protein
MKKILALTVIALFVMMPFASFAKTAISDSDLAGVTAQEGVHIAFNNVTVSNVSIGVQSWGQTASGISGYASAGFIGAAITMDGDVISFPATATMDIQVGSNASNKTVVQISLPTINIGDVAGLGGTHALNITQVVTLATDKTLTTNAQVLGTAYMGNVKATVGGGSVQISAL